MSNRIIPMTTHERFGFQISDTETQVKGENSFPLVPVLVIVGGAAVVGFLYYKSMQVSLAQSVKIETDIKNIKKDITRHDINFGEAGEKISLIQKQQRKMKKRRTRIVRKDNTLRNV